MTKRINPKFNSLLFFEVSSISFHQVSEVLTNRSPRLSINGWFHSKNVRIKKQNIIYPNFLTYSSDEYIDTDITNCFKDWINPVYLLKDTKENIRQIFAEKSEIQLENFLNNKKRDDLEKAISTYDVECIWHKEYRPLFCLYDYIPHEEVDGLPNILKEFYIFVHSLSFFKLISELTGVSFGKKEEITNKSNKENENANPPINYVTKGAFFRWKKGFYTLSSDINPEIQEMALDLDFFFNVSCRIFDLSDEEEKDDAEKCSTEKDKSNIDSSWNNFRKLYRINSKNNKTDKSNGFIYYIGDNCSEQFLEIDPRDSCLSIVFRKYECQRFFKYINSSNPTVPFHHFHIRFVDNPTN